MDGKKILLVEGDNDKNVVIHICDKLDIPRPIYKNIIPRDGVGGVLKALPEQIMLAIEEDDVVGAIVDADSSLDKRWNKIRKIVMSSGYDDVPNKPMKDGTIIEPPQAKYLPRLGFWIMPDNQSTGILENFLHGLIPEYSLVPKSGSLYGHVVKSVDSIPDRRFCDRKEPKAIVHTWLAWQKEPGEPMGRSISKDYFNLNAPEVDVFVSWLRRLYFSDSE